MGKSLALLLVFSVLLTLAAVYSQHRAPRPAASIADGQPSNEPAFPLSARNNIAVPAQAAQPNRAADIVALAQQIRRNPEPDQQDAALAKLAESVATSDFRSILDSFGQKSDPGINELRTRLVGRWAQEDPVAAREWVLEQPAGPIRKAALEQIAIVDSNRDLSAAAAWVMELPNGRDEQAAKVSVAYEAARTDPVQALDLASTLPPTSQRDDLLVHAASQWSSTDFSNAVSWALSVNDRQLRDRLVSAVAVGAAKQEPAIAATVAAQAIEPGPEQDRAVVSIVQRWAEESPAETAAWVAQFPEAPLRDAAMQRVVTAWVGQNPDAAETWVDSLPAGGLREEGLAAYEQAVASRAPVGVIRAITE